MIGLSIVFSFIIIILLLAIFGTTLELKRLKLIHVDFLKNQNKKGKKLFSKCIDIFYDDFPDRAKILKTNNIEDLKFKIKNTKFENDSIAKLPDIELEVYYLDLEKNWNKSNVITFIDHLLCLIIYRFNIINSVINPILKKYNEILNRKYDQLIVKDDYGDLDFTYWKREKELFWNKKLKLPLARHIRNLTEELPSKEVKKINIFSQIDNNFNDNLPLWISEYISHYLSDNYNYDKKRSEFNNVDNGDQYEVFIKNMLHDSGIEANKTKASGDQGLDVIANLNGIRIAIQCKYYNSHKVGNDAVQQIYGAKDFYDCHHSIVVTNNNFTKSAKQLANKLNVHLLHHDNLLDFLYSLKARA